MFLYPHLVSACSAQLLGNSGSPLVWIWVGWLPPTRLNSNSQPRWWWGWWWAKLGAAWLSLRPEGAIATKQQSQHDTVTNGPIHNVRRWFSRGACEGHWPTQSDVTDDESDAPLRGYKLNYWAQSMADRVEEPQFQMKQEEFIFYPRVFHKSPPTPRTLCIHLNRKWKQSSPEKQFVCKWCWNCGNHIGYICFELFRPCYCILQVITKLWRLCCFFLREVQNFCCRV